jgi:GT2 family glycosyltransferase
MFRARRTRLNDAKTDSLLVRMVYIVLVNWRRYEDTIECLESLMRMSGEFRVLIVDNESEEKGVNEIVGWADGRRGAGISGEAWTRLSSDRKREPSIAVIRRGEKDSNNSDALIIVVENDENSGFAGGCNIGIKIALSDQSCEFVWLLNNDTVVDELALDHLLCLGRSDDDIGICGSTLLFYDEPDVVQSVGASLNKYTGRIKNVGAGELASSVLANVGKAHDIEYVVGASMLVSRRFLLQVGLMEEEYFLYFEEIDWAYRNGGRFRHSWSRMSLVYHKEGRSIGTNSRGRPSDTTIYFYNMNFLRFIRRFCPLILPLAVLRVAVACVAFRISGDMGGYRSFKMVLFDFFTGKRRRGPIVNLPSTI